MMQQCKIKLKNFVEIATGGFYKVIDGCFLASVSSTDVGKLWPRRNKQPMKLCNPADQT